MIENIRLFIKGKYHDLLVFFGLRVSEHWLLLRSIIKHYGEENAKMIYADAVIVGLKCGVKNNKKTREKIIALTEYKEGKKSIWQ